MQNEYEKFLNNLKDNAHYRSISNFCKKDGKYIYVGDKKLLNLSSNNYLNFADNMEITDEFLGTKYANYSFGSASARLLTGTLPIYNELETLISLMFGTDKTLLFNSGYHANVGIASSLAGKKGLIVSDKLNHASIIDGMRLSNAKFLRYPHFDTESLENILKRERSNFEPVIIYTESVFSMDGDVAPLEKIVEIKEKYNCILVVDEAHAFGVCGKNALGVCEEKNIIDKVELIIGTFGKAIGSVGAFVTGKNVLIEYLINCARSFIFSTALPPVNIAFTKWIIEEKLPNTLSKRVQMLKLGKELGSQSHIVPFIIGENDKTLMVSETLFNNGYFTLPIRPPTVKEGTSRLRLSLTTDIEEKHLAGLRKILNL